MAGLKPKKTTDGFLRVEYWDVETQRRRSIQVACLLTNAQRFADKYRERSLAGKLKDMDGRGAAGGLLVFLFVCLFGVIIAAMAAVK